MTRTNRTDLVLVELDRRVLDRLGMMPIPLPVRKDRAAAIFGDSVDLPGLVSELDAVLSQDQSLAAMCGATLARLAEVEGTRRALEGRLDEAISLFETGLHYRPSYLGLNTKLALALQTKGRHEDAARHYDIALIRRDEADNPIVFVLAARAHADGGDYDGALELLDRCPGDFANDEGFQDLYLHYVAMSA